MLLFGAQNLDIAIRILHYSGPKQTKAGVVLTCDDQDGGRTKCTERIRALKGGRPRGSRDNGFSRGGAMCVAEVAQKV
jgi:hypothetical protein